jgi:two-component system, NarL family, nitrate/nitrite response regulator NarL
MIDAPTVGGPAIRTAVAGEIAIYREGLAEILDREPGIDVVATATSAEETLEIVARIRPRVVLLDMAMPKSIDAVHAVNATASEVKVLALCVPDIEHEIIACAEAGVAGYVTRQASLTDVIAAVESVVREETLCSPRIAAALLRHVASLAAERERALEPCLTARETQVVELLQEGLSNKQIGQRLHIELPTVKNHVHNILEKLNVGRRAEAVAIVQRARGGGTVQRI